MISRAPANERVQLLKSFDEIKRMEDDCEEIEIGDLLKRYVERPPCLENVTLADWAAFYDNSRIEESNTRLRKKDVDGLLLETKDEDNFEDDVESSLKSLANGEAQKGITRRAKARIIRSVWFDKDVDSEKHYRELLFLFTPWRNEARDIDSFQPYEERCRMFNEQIKCQLEQYSPCKTEIDDVLVNNMRDVSDEENMWDLVAPNTQHVELNDTREICRNSDINVENSEENYDLSDDLGISSSYVAEQLTTYHEISDEEYRELVRSLNSEQLIFFYHFLHCLRTSDKPFYCFLSGGAGVGKSHVTKALYQATIKYLNRNVGDDFHTVRAILVAPTGKASYNIRGTTIHTSFRVPINQPLHSYQKLESSRLNTLRTKLGALKVIFLDEISMVGCSMFNVQINKRLQEIKGIEKDFGGVSVVAVGDLFQLKPVFDSYVFEPLKGNYGVLANNLWIKHFKMYELCQIMRQRESRQFAEILNRLREGKHTDDDIRVLKTRLISERDPVYPVTAPHLFIEDKNVQKFNRKVYNRCSEEKFVITALDSVVGTDNKEMQEKLLRKIPSDPRKTMQLAKQLCIAINQRTEIALNIRTEDGLTNGAGNVIKYVELYNLPNPEGVIWVRFDHSDVGKMIRNENRQLYTSCIDPSGTPIVSVSVQFCVGGCTSFKILRRQFPLRPSASKTVHRAQGDTENEIVVDLENWRKVPHIHHVAMSRVTKLEGLHILNLDEGKICVSSKVKEEMMRLRTSACLQPCLQRFRNLDDSYIKFMFLNARSLHKHFFDVKNDMNFFLPHVAIFAETRFCGIDRNEEYEVDNFTLFRNDGMIVENQRSFYGIAVCYSIECCAGYPKCYNILDVEIVITKYKCLPSVIIAGIYRSPSVPLRQCYEALRRLHCSVLNYEPYRIIIGDFNVNLFDHKEKSGLDKLLVLEFGYSQYVRDCTTINNTQIDLIYTNVEENCVKVGILETYYSDHKAVWIALDRRVYGKKL